MVESHTSGARMKGRCGYATWVWVRNRSATTPRSAARASIVPSPRGAESSGWAPSSARYAVGFAGGEDESPVVILRVERDGIGGAVAAHRNHQLRDAWVVQDVLDPANVEANRGFLAGGERIQLQVVELERRRGHDRVSCHSRRWVVPHPHRCR